MLQVPPAAAAAGGGSEERFKRDLDEIKERLGTEHKFSIMHSHILIDKLAGQPHGPPAPAVSCAR